MNKKGQGLPLNTIIIAILVVIVLVIVVAFFLGGMTGLTRSIRSVFFGTTAGTDLTLATQTCQTRCDQAQFLPKETRVNSAFCKQDFYIDKDNDGEADYIDPSKKEGGYKKFYCYKESTGKGEESLAVVCINKEDNTRITCV